MIRKNFLLAMALLLPLLANAQARLLRHPSYANGKVAFSYLGDIWIAHEDGTGVQRLTDHRAREVFPRFSPDGNWVAFSSDREGNYDVYVVAAAGGQPRRLTFHSANDLVAGWTPDGKRIVFESARNEGVFPGLATLWEISVDGGMEQPLPADWGSWASYSPDGSKLAFTRHPGVWSRKHYRGSYAVDLWLEDLTAKKFTSLADPDYKGNYLWPMYGAKGDIYYVADELPGEKSLKWGGPEVMKSVNNLWKIAEGGGKPVQITHYTNGDLLFPSISADRKTIVFERNFGLWKLDLPSGKATEIRVAINSDVKDSETEVRSMTSADGFQLSPSGKRAAIVTHGEIFTIATDRGEPQRVTETSAREQDPRWSPDGKWIAFVSDRTGREEVWMADELGHNLKQLSDVDCDKSALQWAPDSKSLLWAGSDTTHKLRRVFIEDGRTDELASSDAGTIGMPQFSPDGKWVCYSKDDPLLRSHVFVKPLDGGEEHRLDFDDFPVSSGAKWTPDGKKLLLLGGVGAPAMSSLNRSTMQLYSLTLARIEKNPDDERDINTEAQAMVANETPRRGRAAAADAASPGEDESTNAVANTPRRGRAGSTRTNAPVEVKIDWTGLERRLKKLTSMAGSVSVVVPAPDSRTYALVAMGGDAEEGGPGLYTMADDGTRLTRINTGVAPPSAEPVPRGRGFGGGGRFGDLQWSKDSRNLYYLQSGNINSVTIPAAPPDDSSAGSGLAGSGGRSGGARGFRGSGGSAATAGSDLPAPRRITFNVRMEINQAEERKEVFQEAWRTMKNRFYDCNMNGVDWAAARNLYEPLLSDVADTEELHNVIMEMIGELNASHTGISGGGNADQSSERPQTRYPGFDLEPDASGCFKVAYIYKNGPADRDYVKLATGDFVLAVNGKLLRTSENYWKQFDLVPGRKFEFTVNSRPDTNGAWSISIDPVSAATQADFEYARWVDNRKAMVARLSQGRVGYLHIKAMDAPSYERFQRDLLENLDKKALIIDERFNGGGGIDQELLAILSQRRKYESWRSRDSVEIPRPVQAFFGPMAVLENERSASNAEMFPEGFRTLGLGKVIGVPTYGAVIGTGAFRLLDGSTLRTPSVGVYTASGQNFENYGVPPDVYVDNTPADFLSGHDRQIEKAVEVLCAEIK